MSPVVYVIAGVLVLLLLGLAYQLTKQRPSDADDPDGSKQKQLDGNPMTVQQRGFLVGFLLVVALVLMFLLVTLNGVEFSDPQAAIASAPLLNDPPKDTKPLIKQLDPRAVVLSNPGPVEMRVYGYNFKEDAKLRFNKADHDSTRIGDNLIITHVQPSDVPGGHPVDVVVTSGGVESDAKQLAVLVSTSKPWNIYIRSFQITRELQLLLLVLVAGALGSYVHAIKSLTDFLGNRTLTRSWFWFYVTRPFLGMVLAVIFYAVIRGGFVAGSPADVKSVNPFGVIAIAALVGMFADAATQKLGEIFDALFKTTDSRGDKLVELAIVTESLSGTANKALASTQLVAKGATAGAKWTVVSGLPAGLTLDSHGLLTGTPTAAGQSTMKVSLTDGGHTVQKDISVTIATA